MIGGMSCIRGYVSKYWVCLKIGGTSHNRGIHFQGCATSGVPGV